MKCEKRRKVERNGFFIGIGWSIIIGLGWLAIIYCFVDKVFFK